MAGTLGAWLLIAQLGVVLEANSAAAKEKEQQPEVSTVEMLAAENEELHQQVQALQSRINQLKRKIRQDELKYQQECRQ